jgi:hypothetical protein
MTHFFFYQQRRNAISRAAQLYSPTAAYVRTSQPIAAACCNSQEQSAATRATRASRSGGRPESGGRPAEQETAADTGSPGDGHGPSPGSRLAGGSSYRRDRGGVAERGSIQNAWRAAWHTATKNSGTGRDRSPGPRTWRPQDDCSCREQQTMKSKSSAGRSIASSKRDKKNSDRKLAARKLQTCEKSIGIKRTSCGVQKKTLNLALIPC